MTKIKCRKASINDVSQLIELRKLLLSQGSGHYVSNSQEEDQAWQLSYREWLYKTLDYSDNVYVAVATLDESQNVVACVIGIIDERAPMKGCLNAKMGWLQTMVVHPEQRNKGIAKQILQFMLVWFELNDVKKVCLQTTEMARDFYHHMNFKNSGEDLLIVELT